MSDGAIKAYSDRIAEMLVKQEFKPVPEDALGLQPYERLDVQGNDLSFPFTTCYVFGWAPEIEKERKAWEQMVHNFKASLAYTYPTSKVCNIDLTLDNPRQFPLFMAQAYAKFRRSLRGNLLMADVDIVAYNPADPFSEDFDVGLTDCEDLWPMMPFNAGVQFYKDTPGAQKYLDLVMQLACAMPSNTDHWYMQQLAMSQAFHMLKDEVKFLIFPYEEYNFTPLSNMYEETDAYFVHARGQRKNLHVEYVKQLAKRSENVGPDEDNRRS